MSADLPLGALPRVRRRPEAAARPSRRQVLLSLGALGLAGGLSWRLHDAAGWQRVWAQHTTSVGQRRRLALPDGSVLHLNTDSAVNIRYDAHARRIELVAGEIHVESAADPQGRGLWVEAPEGRAQIAGARARLWREAQATGIAVDAGAAALWPARWTSPQAAAIVASGQQARLTMGDAVDLRQPPAGGARDDRAWMHGTLSVRDLPLGAFLDELARHHGRIVHGHDLAGLRVSGDFRLDDTRAVLDELSQALPVTVSRQRSWWGNTATRVQRRPGSGPA